MYGTRQKKTLHTVAFSWCLCGTAAIKLRSNFTQTMLKLRSNSSKWSTCDKTLLSQLFYSTCWLCTCGPYIQVLIVLSTLVIIAKTPLWALPAFYALVKGWSKYGKRTVRPEFFSRRENSTVCKVFFDAYRRYIIRTWYNIVHFAWHFLQNQVLAFGCVVKDTHRKWNHNRHPSQMMDLSACKSLKQQWHFQDIFFTLVSTTSRTIFHASSVKNCRTKLTSTFSSATASDTFSGLHSTLSSSISLSCFMTASMWTESTNQDKMTV